MRCHVALAPLHSLIVEVGGYGYLGVSSLELPQRMCSHGVKRCLTLVQRATAFQSIRAPSIKSIETEIGRKRTVIHTHVGPTFFLRRSGGRGERSQDVLTWPRVPGGHGAEVVDPTSDGWISRPFLSGTPPHPYLDRPVGSDPFRTGVAPTNGPESVSHMGSRARRVRDGANRLSTGASPPSVLFPSLVRGAVDPRIPR